jgi:hypothetical protein
VLRYLRIINLTLIHLFVNLRKERTLKYFQLLKGCINNDVYKPQKNILRLITLINMFILLLGLSFSGCGGSRAENTPPTVKIGDVNLFYFVTDTLYPSKELSK